MTSDVYDAVAVRDLVEALSGNVPVFRSADGCTTMNACPALAYTAFVMLNWLVQEDVSV